MRTLIKRVVHSLGYSIVPVHRSPLDHFLGLRHREIGTVIDIGANEGRFAASISRVLPDATIYCFEPQPHVFKVLKEWAELQPRVKAFEMALGEAEGRLPMHVHLDHSPSSSLLDTTVLGESLYPQIKRQDRIEVQLRTLDSVSEELRLFERAGEMLVKMDVQGYEDRVVRGGRRTLAHATACLLEVNLDTLYDGQAGFRELVLLLEDSGLTYGGNLDQVYAADGHVVYADALFVRRGTAAA